MSTKLYYFRTKRKLLKWCRERGYSLRACEEAWLIDERIGAYGTPNPVIVDEKEIHLQIPSYS